MADEAAATSVEPSVSDHPPTAVEDTVPSSDPPPELETSGEPQEPPVSAPREQERVTPPPEGAPVKRREIERASSSEETAEKNRVFVKVILLDGEDCLLNCSVSEGVTMCVCVCVCVCVTVCV